jgi:methylmalonyl-CoA carboxyltransferase large subunit
MHEGEARDIETLLAEIHAQLADLGKRVSRLEEERPVAEHVAASQRPTEPTREDTGLAGASAGPKSLISEEKLLAISAAVAAFLGERVRIRQIRLIRSNAWAQQGRVSVQASHWLHR